MKKKILKGLLDGTIGIDIVEIFDSNGDKKVSWKEIKSASLDQWIKAAVSLGTSILSILWLV